MKPPKITAASGRPVFVHRFKWGHAAIRKQLRRALKDGDVELITTEWNGLLYYVPFSFKMKDKS